MLVWQKVKAYVDENGIKQTVLARKTGIPLSTFNAILHGKRTMFAEDLRSICCALKVSPELFINCDDEDNT